MLDRRNFINTCSAMGLTGTLLPGVLWGQAEAQKTKEITKEMIDNASAIAGVSIDNEYKDMMLGALHKQVKGYEEIYKLHIPNSVPPALLFDPVLPAMTSETARRPMRMSNAPDVEISDNPEALAFASVRELAEIVRTKKISSMALTQMHLGRFKKVRSEAAFCCDPDRRARAGASPSSRRGDCCRKIPWSPAWAAMGRKGFVGDQRLPDYMGSRAASKIKF